MGLDLIEWTYDPMQAMNAHLNFAKLGVVVEEYEVNVYGMSNSPLHGGNPTDRFVCEWKVNDPRVEQRIAGGAPLASVLTVEPVLRTKGAGEWLEPDSPNLSIDAKRISVEIPTGFTGMLAQAPELALAWRMATREVFTTYFDRGYRAVEFFLDRPARKGAYLLVKN
jgi:predicted GNAT superfamily acetyltransferase